MIIQTKYLLIVIVILFAIIGFQFFMINCKRRENIIKLLVRKDSLPAAATGTTWIQQGTCYMKDGKLGAVDGNDCMSIEVL